MQEGKKEAREKKVRQTITQCKLYVKIVAVYIKIYGVQQMEHKCAKKEKVQKQPAG